MKKIRIILLSLLLYSATGYAQEITGREYFYDTDHGVGTGTLASFTASDSITETITLPTTGLSIGFHRVYTRYHYNTGAWGIAEDRPFYIYDTTSPVIQVAPNMVSGEYFFDTDLGVGTGTAVPAFTAGDSVQQNITFSTVGLGVGFHRIYTRYKYLNNSWGIAEDRLFYIYDTTHPVLVKQAPIVAGEYFIDNEPGPGHGTAIVVNPAQDSLQQTFTFSTTSLALGIHYIYIRYRDTNGKWGIAEPVEFQVCTPPAASIVASGDTTFCYGSSVLLTTDSIHGYTYQWQNNNNNLPGDTTHTLVVNSNSGLYTVLITNATGCQAVSNSIDITVNAQPTVTANGPTSFCKGDSVILTASPATSYSWTGGATTESITVTTSGSFTVTVTANSCTSSSAPITVTVNQPPTPVIFQNGSLLYTQSGYAYDWYYSTDSVTFTIVPSSNTDSITITQNGYYYVRITDTTSCSSSAGTKYYVVTGVTTVDADYSITVYPNPASDEVILQSGVLNNTKAQLELHDVTGKIIYAAYESVANRIKVNTTSLAAGMYFIVLKLNDKEISLKFIKN